MEREVRSEWGRRGVPVGTGNGGGRWFAAMVLGLAVLVSVPAGAVGSPGADCRVSSMDDFMAVERRLQRDFPEDEAGLVRGVSDTFDASIRPCLEQVPVLSGDALDDLFDAVAASAFYLANSLHSTRPDVVDALVAIGEALHAIDRWTPAQAQTLSGVLLMQRAADDRQLFLLGEDDSAGLARVLASFDAARRPADTTPVALQVTGPDNRLVATFPMAGDAPRLIVVGEPRCAFTRRAGRAIQSDPAVSGWMARHALWLVPPRPDLAAGAIADWNSAHPDLPLHLVDRAAAWSTHVGAFGSWPAFFGTGTNGERFALFGWPDGGMIEALREALGIDAWE